jgi:hypothetical protein
MFHVIYLACKMQFKRYRFRLWLSMSLSLTSLIFSTFSVLKLLFLFFEKTTNKNNKAFIPSKLGTLELKIQ